MTTTSTTSPAAPAPQRYRPGQTEVVTVLVALVLVAQSSLVELTDSDALRTWSTMFVAVVVQAIPFLVTGVVLAAAISTFVSERLLQRLLPGRPALAVPVAGVAGIALPGCECASVPVASSLVRGGVVPAAAFTFLLAAPAVNPVVVVSTAVAFPGRPDIVAARFLASMLVALLVGWVWALVGHRVPVRMPARRHGEGAGRLARFLGSAQHDLIHSAGFLVAGGMIAATVNAFVPRRYLDSLAEQALLSVLVLAVFAFVVAMCSEADAFVAASMTAFSDTAKLAFMVVGPAVDVKLAGLQAGNFGRAFALRFAPLTFVVAVATTLLVGGLLL